MKTFFNVSDSFRKMVEWSTDIFGCFANTKWCLVTCFCPCVTSYTIASKMGMKLLGLMSAFFCILYWAAYSASSYLTQMSLINNDEDDTQNDSNYTAAVVASVVALVMLIAFVTIVGQIRRVFRQKHDIEGDAAEDCCLSCFCSSCVLCQMQNHSDMEMIRA